MAGRLAVVLSGGGAKGAFQVGALDQLITKRKVKFDIAVGTSTGAIQAAAVAQDDIPRLVRTWEGIKGDEDIYKKRSGTLLAVITGQPSIYNAKPLARPARRQHRRGEDQGERQEPPPWRGQPDQRQVP